MFNEIITGVCSAIHSEFENAHIYTEHVEQNCQTPAFFVFCNAEKTSIRRYRGRRFLARNGVVITYVPRNDGVVVNENVNEVLEKLFMRLEYITAAEHTYRGTNMNIENYEGYSAFFVSYDFFFTVEDDTELMMLLHTNTGVTENVGT